ncbi:MAG: M20/M25/M40 family metallo-hydrolase, partial [Candidatus Hermodarchaeota archaeon]|nr:M20/M25/M40 family metallo-hydrolase [Candidatus Hermodarchaeota archaeon]
MNVRNILDEIDAQFDESIQELQTFLRQPSISGTGAGINRTIYQVLSKLEALGFEAAIHPTRSNPILFGKNLKAGPEARTLLIQTSIDVMTTENEAWWSVPPFAAEVKNTKRFGPSLIARGAYTQKATLMALLQTLAIIKEVGESLPVNLMIVVDSEEESGSPSLETFVKTHQTEFETVDAVYYPFFSTDRRGIARLFLGTKGIVFLRLSCQGPSTRDLHSAEVGWIRNPAHILAKALSSLVDIHGHPQIPGLLDDVVPPNEDDERLLKLLAESFDPGIAALQLEARNLSIEADSLHDLLRRFLFQPTVNISGIQTGYVGNSYKTILPREAAAHVDIRLTPNEDPQKVLQVVKAHLKQQGLIPLVKVELGYTMNWAKSSDNTPIARALMKSYYDAGVDNVEVWPMFPSSIPLYVYADSPLQKPFVIGGLGHGGHAHGRDEYVVVEGIRHFQKGFTYFLHEYSQIRGGS